MSDFQTDPAILRWDFIEKIANNELSKIVGVIPIVGYLILFNDGLVSSLSFNTLVGSGENVDSPFLFGNVLKLRLTFFGSLFILVANISFKLFAPKVLVYSKTDIAFSDKVAESYSAAEVQSIEKKVLSKGWIRSTPLVDASEEFNARIKSGDASLSGIKEKRFMMRDKPEYVRALAREWWAGEIRSKVAIRRITFSICILGYSMLAVPTVDIAQAVIRDLF